MAVYDDRLEVTSSGTLHFGLTPEKLFAPHESLPWNSLIAGTFYRLGLIEELGRGTLKVAEATASVGLPRPEIEVAGGCVTVRFRRAKVTVRPYGSSGVTDRVPDAQTGQREMENLNNRLQAILAVLDREGQPLALREIRAGLAEQVDERRLREDLAGLKAKGLIAPAGRGCGARWRRL